MRTGFWCVSDNQLGLKLSPHCLSLPQVGLKLPPDCPYLGPWLAPGGSTQSVLDSFFFVIIFFFLPIQLLLFGIHSFLCVFLNSQR